MTGPVFIIGCPRSGTSLLLNLLAGTRAYGYVSMLGDRDEVDDCRHDRNRTYDTPLVGAAIYRHRRVLLNVGARLGPVGDVVENQLPQPFEPWRFWSDLLPNFRPEFGTDPADDPRAEDLTEDDRVRARDIVADLLVRQRRSVLLSKYTDFPRVELVHSVFPDARFVHIRRDRCAVAASNAVEIETGRFGTWRQRDWWAERWDPAAQEHWRANGESVLGFAGHNRNRLVGLIDDAVAATTAPTLTVAYEDLTRDPVALLEQILAFSGLESRSSLERLCRSRRVANTNDSWRTRRSAAEISLLDEIMSARSPWKVPT